MYVDVEGKVIKRMKGNRQKINEITKLEKENLISITKYTWSEGCYRYFEYYCQTEEERCREKEEGWWKDGGKYHLHISLDIYLIRW